ncbi:MAG: phytanoyl-CoA dioxygenase family protein [Actinobacteria bacterium]|nr:phytanoyl-CoA dioxygenase family protein [Actinomycetota bacterium]
MSTLDVRTRTEAAVRGVDPRTFFDDELPSLAADRSHHAVPAAMELRMSPFCIATPSGAWTVSIRGDRVCVDSGDAGDARVELDDDEVGKLVDDLITPMTLVASARLRMVRGNLGDFLDWWVVLRALIDGRDAHTAGSVQFHDRDGAPLDFGRRFGPDDDDAEIAHFLCEAGFLHLEGWFDEGEMEQISRDVDAALPRYTPDDGRSWWAEIADGTQRAVRLQRFEEHSAALASLLLDERFLRIGRLTDDGYVARTTAEALEKPIGVVKGISDLLWHKDCSLGMHSYTCSGLTVGVSVTGADESSGQLSVVPGSHRALVQPALHRTTWGLPPRDLPTCTGDLTVHCSCTLHMSHPPVARERRVVYTGFGLPTGDTVAAEHQAAVSDVREHAYKKVSQDPSPVATRQSPAGSPASARASRSA